MGLYIPGGGERQPHAEGRTLADAFRVCAYVPAMGARQLVHQRQADPEASACIGGAALLLREQLEEPVHGFRGDAPAVVRHSDPGESRVRGHAHLDDPAVAGELHGVLHEIADDLFDPDAVGATRQRIRGGDVEPQAEGRHGFRHGPGDARHERAEVERFDFQPELADPCTGHVEQIAHQSRLPSHRGADIFAQLAQLLVVALRTEAPDEIGLHHHRRQRLPQFVRGDHDEPVPCRGGLHGFVACRLQPSKSAGLFVPHGPTSCDVSMACRLGTGG